MARFKVTYTFSAGISPFRLDCLALLHFDILLIFLFCSKFYTESSILCSVCWTRPLKVFLNSISSTSTPQLNPTVRHEDIPYSWLAEHNPLLTDSSIGWSNEGAYMRTCGRSFQESFGKELEEWLDKNKVYRNPSGHIRIFDEAVGVSDWIVTVR